MYPEKLANLLDRVSKLYIRGCVKSLKDYFIENKHRTLSSIEEKLFSELTFLNNPDSIMAEEIDFSIIKEKEYELQKRFKDHLKIILSDKVKNVNENLKNNLLESDTAFYYLLRHLTNFCGEESIEETYLKFKKKIIPKKIFYLGPQSEINMNDLNLLKDNSTNICNLEQEKQTIQEGLYEKFGCLISNNCINKLKIQELEIMVEMITNILSANSLMVIQTSPLKNWEDAKSYTGFNFCFWKKRGYLPLTDYCLDYKNRVSLVLKKIDN